MPIKHEKEFLGLFGEYAVASELCRRRAYPQLTLGHHKQTDILVETEDRVLRVSVKTKQGNTWPSISGLYRTNDFLVLVDMKGKGDGDVPDFYILNLKDWIKLVANEKVRRSDIEVDKQNRVVYPDGWKGLNVKLVDVAKWKDRWDKIVPNKVHG